MWCPHRSSPLSWHPRCGPSSFDEGCRPGFGRWAPRRITLEAGCDQLVDAFGCRPGQICRATAGLVAGKQSEGKKGQLVDVRRVGRKRFGGDGADVPVAGFQLR
jgi:hypothetical protein